MNPTAPEPRKQRCKLERSLSTFTEVRAGESSKVLALTFNIFLILIAYYLIKPVHEALILSIPGGAEQKSYATAGQALLLLVPAYGWLASRVPRMRLIDAITPFFASCLAVFYILIIGGVPVAIAFLLWVGVFNLMVSPQFWAFSNETYSPEAGKRSFVLLAFGASAGVVFGSYLADEMIHHGGVDKMLLIALGLLLATLRLSYCVHRRELQSPKPRAVAFKRPEETLEKGNAFGFVFRNCYLLLLARILPFNNWVNSNGEYNLGRIVKDAADVAALDQTTVNEDEFIASFYARFFGVVNLVGMLLQLFVVLRVIKYIGVPVAIFLLPAITIGSYESVSFILALGVMCWAKTVQNSIGYSLQSAIKQVLYLPTTRTEKYKTKQAIDTFFVRSGDLCSAGLVLTGTHLFVFGVREFALANAALSAIWLLLSVRLGQRFRTLVSFLERGRQ